MVYLLNMVILDSYVRLPEETILVLAWRGAIHKLKCSLFWRHALAVKHQGLPLGKLNYLDSEAPKIEETKDLPCLSFFLLLYVPSLVYYPIILWLIFSFSPPFRYLWHRSDQSSGLASRQNPPNGCSAHAAAPLSLPKLRNRQSFPDRKCGKPTPEGRKPTVPRNVGNSMILYDFMEVGLGKVSWDAIRK